MESKAKVQFNSAGGGGTPYKSDGDARFLPLGCKLQLLVSLRVVKSSRLPAKITKYLVSTGWLLCLVFLYKWCFLNKISLDWLLTMTTQLFTSKLSEKPWSLTVFGMESYNRYLCSFRYCLIVLCLKKFTKNVPTLTTQKSPLWGQVVSVSDPQSGGPGFESRSGHLLDLFSVELVSRACKKPTGCLLPVGVFNPVMLYLNDLFLSIWVEFL